MNISPNALGISTAVVCAAAYLAVAVPAAPPPPQHPSLLRLAYDSSGMLMPSSRAAFDAAVAAAEGSDVVVMSHGWWNDADTAECTYSQMAEGFLASRPATVPPDRRTVLVAIYWPSAIFPIGEPACGGATQPPVEESSRSGRGFRPADVAAWSAAAFPDAARTPGFAAERARLEDLLNRGATAEGLSPDEGTKILAILSAWEQQSAGAMPDESAGEQNIRVDANAMAAAWLPEPDGRTEPEAGGPRTWLNVANLFTFWAMKSRAGIVGSRGVYEFLHAVQPARARGARLHLVGHSFGGKVLSAALVGSGGGPPNQVDSMLILQGALSHFAFSTVEQLQQLRVPTSQPGLYRRISTDRLVSGVFAATYSSHDSANRFWYPKGVRLSRDDFEASRPARWGSLGFDGFQGPSSAGLSLADTKSAPASALWSIDASEAIGEHSDILKPDVYHLMWRVIELSAR